MVRLTPKKQGHNLCSLKEKESEHEIQTSA